MLHLHLVQLLPVSLQRLNGIHNLCSGLIGHPYLWLGNIFTGQDGAQDASQLGRGQALHDSSCRVDCWLVLEGLEVVGWCDTRGGAEEQEGRSTPAPGASWKVAEGVRKPQDTSCLVLKHTQALQLRNLYSGGELAHDSKEQ